jgi:pSer/pThr/pTyr-binding forkhead associated (FHA) protein
MRARLVCIDAAVVIDEIRLEKFPVTIGRSADATICIPNEWISRLHCVIDPDGEWLRVRDLRSRNGTFLNGDQITETLIKPGDKLTIGMSTFLVQYDSHSAEMPSTVLYEPSLE